MRRNLNLLIVVLSVASFSGIRVQAQDSSSKAPEAAKSWPAYHLDFTLSELEDGKKINTRQYAMDLVAMRQGGHGLPFGPTKDLKIGTRVPVEVEQGKVEYLDIGTRISCMANVDEADQLTLDTRAEVSSIVPRSDADVYRPASRNPIVRQLSIQTSAAVTPGKQTSLGTVDDPDSKRQFQLQVLVTRVR